MLCCYCLLQTREGWSLRFAGLLFKLCWFKVDFFDLLNCNPDVAIVESQNHKHRRFRPWFCPFFNVASRFYLCAANKQTKATGGWRLRASPKHVSSITVPCNCFWFASLLLKQEVEQKQEA